MIRLVGTFLASSGARGARVVRANARPLSEPVVSCNGQLDPALRVGLLAMLPEVSRVAQSLGAGSAADGMSLHIVDPPSQMLTDLSYSLPIAVALIGDLTGVALSPLCLGYW